MRIYGSRISAHMHLQIKWKSPQISCGLMILQQKLQTEILSSPQEKRLRDPRRTTEENAAGWLFVRVMTFHQLCTESNGRIPVDEPILQIIYLPIFIRIH
jgi:hypothetical protein